MVGGISKVIDLDQVANGVDCTDHELICLVGGGGKTTLMYALTRGLDGTRVATTTTRMGADQHGDLPTLVGASNDEIVEAAILEPTLAWRSVSGGKAYGLNPERCDLLFDRLDHVIVEADGARRKPFKAPGPFEPVIPSSTTLMISVIGADALGRVIADQCHRPLRVAALAGCHPYVRLTPNAAATVLLHPQGQREALRENARLVVAITKVDDSNVGLIEELAGELARREPGLQVLRIASFN